MVVARQFEINECKIITTEKERIMELEAKVEIVRVSVNKCRSKKFNNKI